MKAAALAVACLFALVAGSNDGATLLTTGLGVEGFRPFSAIGLLLVAIVLGPAVLLPTSVATTLAHQLVPFSAHSAAGGALVSTAGALVVVFCLARSGLPTSLTVALLGALAGAGLAAGTGVDWFTLGRVLAVGLAAPALCALVAFGAARYLLRALSWPLPGRRNVDARLRHWHLATYSLQCLAYSANGGQKMLAVFALALGSTTGDVRDPLWQALSLAALFGAGLLVSFRKVAANLGRSVLTLRLRHAFVAEACCSVAVLAAGFTGTPLTLSQCLAGALVGAGSSESARRVRWAQASKVASAWAFTFPAALGLGYVGGLLLRWA